MSIRNPIEVSPPRLLRNSFSQSYLYYPPRQNNHFISLAGGQAPIPYSIRRSWSCPKIITTTRGLSQSVIIGNVQASPGPSMPRPLSTRDLMSQSLSLTNTSFRLQGTVPQNEIYISPRVISSRGNISSYRDDNNMSLTYSNNQSEGNTSYNEEKRANSRNASPLKSSKYLRVIYKSKFLKKDF